jgi:hypothetical protein
MVEKNESKNFEMFSCAIIEKRHILAGVLMARLRRYGKRVTDEQIIQ